MKRILVMTGLLAVSQAAFALDFNGYVRANAGTNSASGGQTCFGLAGAGSKYRLGNECGFYGEVMFGQDVARVENGTTVKANVMFNLSNGGVSDPRLATGGTDVGLPQIYFSAANVPALGGATAWMGRRYYKREDIHVTDFFYWNPAGIGAGLEDLPVGSDGLKFSYAMLRDDKSVISTRLSNSNAPTRHDFQLRGLKVNPGGQLEFGLSLVAKDAAENNRSSGAMLTVQHRQAEAFGGENKFAVQYGTGAAATSNGGNGADTGSAGGARRFRVVEGLYFQPTAKFGGQMVAVYQRDSPSNGNPSVVWTTLGGRIAYGVTQHVKLLADLGQDRVTPEGDVSRRLTKFTLAVALSDGPGYYSRPELRLFYTRAVWNVAARNAAAAGDAISATGAFGNATGGSVIGVTAESWW
ncbi:MAG TPA: carbohydrate porin [Rhodocyclaceae bacterium]|nr:carbohydrate porin [Rhodocyclaceae bacterium]